MGTTHLERLSRLPCRLPDWQGSNRQGRQSRLQRLEVEPTPRASKIARTTTADTTATVEATPRRKEAFRQLINVACGRSSTAGQAITQTSDRQQNGTGQRPPKRHKNSNASVASEATIAENGTGTEANATATTNHGYTAPTAMQDADTRDDGDYESSSIFDADADADADDGTGGYGTGGYADDDYGCTPMTDDDDDGPDEGMDGRSIIRSIGAHSRHVGSDPEFGRGSGGEMCQPQHFQMHEPVVEHCLVAADSALDCDEVVSEGKRQGEQLPCRAECPKRPRRPG